MSEIPILAWSDIPEENWDTLFLGNGASIAIHDGFKYQSLYQQAYSGDEKSSERLFFEKLQTCDFEHVLNACRTAELIISALGKETAEIQKSYSNIRQTLIEAVKKVHPVYATVKNQLERAGAFGSRFRTVISLNYDLTFYWAALLFNEERGPWYKEAFIISDTGRNQFREDWSFLREARFPAENATMIFYPHGNLCLARDIQGNEFKIISGQPKTLLEAVAEQWKIENVYPLFVSEGTSRQKKLAIQQSGYLWNISENVLKNACATNLPFVPGTMIIYGWNVNENDNHILDALAHSNIRKFAISVFSGVELINQQSYCFKIREKFKQKFPSAEIIFFNAQSPGCWIY
jgi:hypothetical protein